MDGTPRPQLEDRLAALESKIESIYISVEKTRKYILLSTILTVVFVVVPLLLAALAVPFILSSFTSYATMLQL